MRFSELRSQRSEVRGQRRPPRGFSLIEVMIAVIIVGIMAGAVTYVAAGMLDRAKRKRAIADISTLANMVDIYYGDHGRFPTTQEGLGVLSANLKNDPWGRPYQYVQPGRNAPYDIICYGADGREGGTGADADITNNDKDVVEQKK